MPSSNRATGLAEVYERVLAASGDQPVYVPQHTLRALLTLALSMPTCPECGSVSAHPDGCGIGGLYRMMRTRMTIPRQDSTDDLREGEEL